MDPILELAGAAGVPVVEDACQAHGARYKGRRVGTLGAAGCFSFYPAKNLGAWGDGGAVVTDDAAIADQVRLLRSHGERPRYHHRVVGTTARLDGLQAAILRVKLRRLDGWNVERREAARALRQALIGTGVELPLLPVADGDHVYHLFVVRCDDRDGAARAPGRPGHRRGRALPGPDPPRRGVRRPRARGGQPPAGGIARGSRALAAGVPRHERGGRGRGGRRRRAPGRARATRPGEHLSAWRRPALVAPAFIVLGPGARSRPAGALVGRDMELVTILRELWHRRTIVALVALVSLIVGAAVAFRLPSLESRKYEVGIATARILVDTPEVAGGRGGAAGLRHARRPREPHRQPDGRRRRQGRHRQAGGPQARRAEGVAENTAGTSGAAAAEPTAFTADHVLTTRVIQTPDGDRLPIIDIETQAPDTAGAAKLADAAVAGLSDYLDSRAASEEVTAAKRLRFTSLGPAAGRRVVRGPRDPHGPRRGALRLRRRLRHHARPASRSPAAGARSRRRRSSTEVCTGADRLFDATPSDSGVGDDAQREDADVSRVWAERPTAAQAKSLATDRRAPRKCGTRPVVYQPTLPDVEDQPHFPRHRCHRPPARRGRSRRSGSPRAVPRGARRGGGRHDVRITFDDGNASDLEHALPALLRAA